MHMFHFPACVFVALALFLVASAAASERSRNQEDVVRVTKASDRDTRVTGTFAVPRETLFEAITRPDHLKHWMSASGMALVETQVDGRPDGTFRYVFQRPNGKKIEVRGAYKTFDPPRGFSYIETYDFSPLKIDVTNGA